MELLLHVLKFAMTSPHPIIDPLSPPSSENLSTLEKCRGNQIAIHFLSACRALHDEGTAYIWERNQFIFTSPQALRQLKRLDLRFRRTIKHITLRVIAHYFDDTDRQHMLEADYHPDLKTNRPLKVQRRLQRFPLVPGGFRCYTWLQIVDFLAALRSPYDHLDQLPRLFMLPDLTSLRLDLVNFSTELVPMPGPEFHDMATHQLGCQLNELHVTGLPSDETGERAYIDLSGLLKDEGLYLRGSASFYADKKHLQVLSGDRWSARDRKDLLESVEFDDDDPFSGLIYPTKGVLPAAPAQRNPPASTCTAHTTIWKRVPKSRDDEERQWIEFLRATGSPLSTRRSLY